MDGDAFKFAWDVFIMLLGYLMAISLMISLFVLSAVMMIYAGREAVVQARAHWRWRRERKMWDEVGDILEASGFDDEEGGDRWLLSV